MTRPARPPPPAGPELAPDRHVRALQRRNLKKLKGQARRERLELAEEAARSVVAVPALGNTIHDMTGAPRFAAIGVVTSDEMQIVMVAEYDKRIATMFALPLSDLEYRDASWYLTSTSRLISDAPAGGPPTLVTP